MRTLQVPVPGREYPVLIGRGSRSALAPRLEALGGVGRIAVIADEYVYALHGARLEQSLKRPHIALTFPAGEASKTLEQAAAFYDELAARRFERDDLILTFGGGVAGDLGGFVAATWLRGLRFVQVPTTLEAAIDASIGGKTAVNHASGKNLIGAFHQPATVLIDTEFLATLPDREFVAGLAESVKHALIREPSFVDWHEQNLHAIRNRDDAALEELIARNCRVKADVVAQDERETGLRRILNFGHTIGHALEHLLEYELRHGECVALGMIGADTLAVQRGLLDPAVATRIATLLDGLGLPTRLPRPVEPPAVLDVCRMDKKVREGRMHFILLGAVGQPTLVEDADSKELACALESIQPE